MSVELPYIEEMRACVAAGHSDLLRGVKAVSKVLNADSDEAWIDAEIAKLAEKIRDQEESVNGLIKVFRDEEFEGVTEATFHEYENSDIDNVLRSRRGLPITYVAIILGVSDYLSLSSFGINFPGVFLAQVDGHVVNPIDFSILDYDAFRERLNEKEIEVPAVPELSSNEEMLRRMFNNLQEVAQVKGDVIRRLEFIDYMEQLEPSDWYAHFKRADVWLSMGDIDGALSELRTARELVTDEETISMLDENLDRVGKASADNRIQN